MVPTNSEQIYSLKTTKVPQGIQLLFYSLELFALLLLLLVLFPFWVQKNAWYFIPITQLLGIAFLIPILMMIFGQSYCLTAPKEIRGKAFVSVALACSCLQFSLTLFDEMLIIHPLLARMSNIVGGLSVFFFLFFLRGLTLYLHPKNFRIQISFLEILVLFLTVFQILLVLPMLIGNQWVANFLYLFPSIILENLPTIVFVSLVFTLLMYSNVLYQLKEIFQTQSSPLE